MYEFPKHKIILELGESDNNCLERIEFQFDSQMSLDNLMNSVFRPLLIGLGYLNSTISEYFNMNECGEEYKEETPDIGDGMLDPLDPDDDGHWVRGDQKEKDKMFLPKTSEEMKDCSDLDTNDL